MTEIIKKTLNKFRLLIDTIFFLILIPASLIMLCFRKYGAHKLPLSKKILNLIGIYPLTDHYYEPQFNFRSLNKNLSENRNLPGINLNLTRQIHNLSNLIYKNELIELNLEKKSTNNKFCIKNDFFGYGDSEIYYQIIRHFKPKKILEIGSGYSTLIALQAIENNKKNDKINTQITCIEPFENKWLDDLNIEILRKKIEDTDESNYLALASGDIFFLDSSHIIRPQGDILKVFLEILPKLNRGVLVQIHDIFTPKDYPEQWIIKENKFWNEQYLVETLMMNENKYEIYLMLNYLKNNAFNELKKVCPYLTSKDQPSSLYLKIK